MCLFHGMYGELFGLYPEDKITSASFPENESDIKLLLNGVYAQLREKRFIIKACLALA